MDGSNPFDAFAADFKSALPGGEPADKNGLVLTMGPPQTAPPAAPPAAPVMNAPPAPNGMVQPGQQGGPPMMGGGMYGGPPNPYGGPPPPMMGGGMQPNGGFGGGYGGPPPPMNGAPMGMNMGPPPGPGGGMYNSNALVPSAQPSNPYEMGPPAQANNFPPAAAPGPPDYGAPPPPGNNFLTGPPGPGAPPPMFGGPPPPGNNMIAGPPPGAPDFGAPPPPGNNFLAGPPAGALPPSEFTKPAEDPLAAAWGAPPPAAPMPAPVGPPAGNNEFDIFGGPPSQNQRPPPPQQLQHQGSSNQLVTSQQQNSQFAMGPPQGGALMFDPMNPPPAPQQEPQASDPWGASIAPSQAPPAIAPGDDPFGGIFGGAAPAPPQQQAPPPQQQQQQQPPASDPWGDMGFAPQQTKPEDDNTTLGGADTITGMRDQPIQSNARTSPAEVEDLFGPPAVPKTVNVKPPAPAAKQKGSLPGGGEYFDARIFTPTLGVMFFKPQELTDSLFLQTDREIVDALEERPVVAFIVEGSSARCAGVELGNVLLKVNGIDVKNPKEASRLIKEGPRPLPLLFYVPNTTVVVAEGEHMVKYDTRETGAPLSAKDWKPKYVVIGGIIAQPWMMNMYRSKAEYDIAVIETQARRPVSVKVKQFSLQGARIQNDWQGPQMVKYKNKLHPWKFIVTLPVSGNPIKISSTSLSQLKPVHEGIRRVLMAQQRGPSAHMQGPTAAPVRQDPYSGERGMSSQRRKTPYEY